MMTKMKRLYDLSLSILLLQIEAGSKFINIYLLVLSASSPFQEIVNLTSIAEPGRSPRGWRHTLALK